MNYESLKNVGIIFWNIDNVISTILFISVLVTGIALGVFVRRHLKNSPTRLPRTGYYDWQILSDAFPFSYQVLFGPKKWRGREKDIPFILDVPTPAWIKFTAGIFWFGFIGLFISMIPFVVATTLEGLWLYDFGLGGYGPNPAVKQS